VRRGGSLKCGVVFVGLQHFTRLYNSTNLYFVWLWRVWSWHLCVRGCSCACCIVPCNCDFTV